MATRGEPSTWFPHAQLVEQERFPRFFVILKTMKMSTKIIDLRRSKVKLFHRGSVLLSKHVGPAVNCEPGFRRELVEQITKLRITSLNFQAWDIINLSDF